MKKSLVPVLVLALFLLTAAPALAGLTWCSTDPLVQLPDGGVVHVQVAVPEGHQHDAFTLTLTAPAGSQLVGQVSKLNLTVVLQAGSDREIAAAREASFPVMVSAQYRNAHLGSYTLESRHDEAVWIW